MGKKRILIVDDEDSIRFGMSAFLEGSGYDVIEADGCSQARALFAASPPDAAVIDYQLDDGTAMELLHNFKQARPDVPLIVMTAYGSVDRAAQAMKAGAERFLDKPIDMRTLLKMLETLFNASCDSNQQQPTT